MSAPQTISEPREGGCLCGNIRYRLSGAALTLYACHCTDCQTQSGSAFGMSMMFLKEQLELLRGAPRTFAKTFEPDGRQKFAKFCADCGARLWVEFSRAPQVVNIKPGTLDDTGALQPIGHIWTRSAQPWVEFGTAGVRCEQEPLDMMELIRIYTSHQHPAGG